MNTGGTTNVGGATSSGGSSGSGCTGNHELIQGNAGLCVAKMVSIVGPVDDAGIADYSIDVTEVTQGQYDAWLSTNPEAPASSDSNCAWNKSYAGQSAGYTGADAEHQPVVNVDWCDAYAYCEGVGKRLCGAITGGPVAYSTGYADASISQWYRACTSGGTHLFPYGDTFQASYCNGNAGSNPQQTATVGSLGQCVTSAAGYGGVYDLSGNVSEWEDSCEPGGQLALCRLRGGSFYNDTGGLTCASDNYDDRNGVSANVGFRCCSL
jgi:formylglycine-generating enzyme required for sulfatase activity